MTKISITFFVGNKILNIFHLSIFSGKNNIFQNNLNFFWGGEMTIFEGKGHRPTKMNNIFCGKLSVFHSLSLILKKKLYLESEVEDFLKLVFFCSLLELFFRRLSGFLHRFLKIYFKITMDNKEYKRRWKIRVFIGHRQPTVTHV